MTEELVDVAAIPTILHFALHHPTAQAQLTSSPLAERPHGSSRCARLVDSTSSINTPSFTIHSILLAIRTLVSITSPPQPPSLDRQTGIAARRVQAPLSTRATATHPRSPTAGTITWADLRCSALSWTLPTAQPSFGHSSFIGLLAAHRRGEHRQPTRAVYRLQQVCLPRPTNNFSPYTQF